MKKIDWSKFLRELSNGIKFSLMLFMMVLGFYCSFAFIAHIIGVGLDPITLPCSTRWA